MRKSAYKITHNGKWYFSDLLRNQRYVCISRKNKRWVKTYLNREFRRKNKERDSNEQF